jgi:SAM-dependent methyltransferase
MLHYHNTGLNVLGLIEPAAKMSGPAAEAVNRANARIGRHFNNRLFWDLRYQKFPERGSGVGSMGNNLILKRRWLADEGIDAAATVLDVGCGNLEVIKVFNPKNYVGLDPSAQAIAAATRKHRTLIIV